MSVVKLRWKAVESGFEKIILKNNILIGHFISDQESPYFNSGIFRNIIAFVNKKPDLFKMKEKNNKLSLTVYNVNTISKAVNFLQTILNG